MGSKKAIAKLMQTEIITNTRPIVDSLKVLQKEVAKSSTSSYKQIEKQLDNIKDQIDDLSSKSELQMLELLESVNQTPARTRTKSTSSTSKSTNTKKKLTS